MQKKLHKWIKEIQTYKEEIGWNEVKLERVSKREVEKKMRKWDDEEWRRDHSAKHA
jgi:hypothetical protein